MIDRAKVAKKLYDDRRRRELYFGSGMFSEPRWDILLDLRAQFDSARIPASLSVCVAAPISTGFRHLHALENLDLVERWRDPNDARRRLSRLTEHGLLIMDQYLDAISR
jgi:DNA-binding MarR family transcriptional regulator